MKFLPLLCALLLNNFALSFAEEPAPVNKQHVLYLLQAREIEKSIDLYREYQKGLGRHDFEVLQQIALLILQQGVKSSDLEIQLTGLFGSKIAGVAASLDVLESAITSPHPQVQLVAVELLASSQEDRSEDLLTKAMSSDFFYTRMDAAFQLALRKSRTAVGQIEALMHKVPPYGRFFFPQFFALIGTHDAIAILRTLLSDTHHTTRIEAILNTARFGRDDLLPALRKRATHLHVAEQEACASAFGILKDSASLPLLQKLRSSPADNVKLAALRSLYFLGNATAKQEIEEMARQRNLFAIGVLEEVPGSEETLAALLQDKDIQVRFNAMASLVKLRDARATPLLKEFLIRDARDLGFQPHFSVGNSLMGWKVIPSALQHQKEEQGDLLALTLHVKEFLLKEALELPTGEFLSIASTLFQKKQSDHVPLLIALLVNQGTSEAIHLLELGAQTTGAPLIRMYCNLGLYHLKPQPAQEMALLHWIEAKKQTEMIRFRPVLPRSNRIQEIKDTYEFTPEENSRLLIECYQAFALKHDTKGIDILLDSLRNGHPKNRPVLAGLLIQAGL
jgi:HEAT repeat protein